MTHEETKDERDRLARRTKILAGQLEQRRAQHVATTDELREARAYIATLEAQLETGARKLERARLALTMAGDILKAEANTRDRS